MSSPFDGIELLPNPHADCELIPCPRCDAEYCLDGIRNGPATIMFTKNAYRVICVECWHRASWAGTRNRQGITGTSRQSMLAC